MTSYLVLGAGISGLAAARALIDTARSVLAGHDLSSAIDARFAVGELTFMAAAASGDWASTSANAVPPPAPDSASARERIFTHIARVQGGYAAAMRGDTAAARRVIEAIAIGMGHGDRWELTERPGPGAHT